MISAVAVILHEKIYSRYSDDIVPKYANTVYIHTMRNTHEPIITMNVGTKLFPRLRDAAIVQSMNAEKEYDAPMIVSLLIPALTTALSGENSDKNCGAAATSISPSTAPAPNEYARLIR